MGTISYSIGVGEVKVTEGDELSDGSDPQLMLHLARNPQLILNYRRGMVAVVAWLSVRGRITSQ
jgi:hypothetical protein